MSALIDILRRRVSQRLDDLGLTAITAAERSSLPRDTLRNIFRGDGVMPRADTMVAIAAALDTSVAFLLGEVSSAEAAALTAQYDGDRVYKRQVPVTHLLLWHGNQPLADLPSERLSTVPAEVNGYEEASLFAGYLADKHAIASYIPGSYIIFAPLVQTGIMRFDTVLVRRIVKGTPEYTLRMLFNETRKGPMLAPISYEKKYKPIQLTDEVSLTAVALAVYRPIPRPHGDTAIYTPEIPEEQQDP